MKKIYSAPQMEVVPMEVGNIIATSDATIEMGTGTAPGVAEGNSRDGNPIWD